MSDKSDPPTTLLEPDEPPSVTIINEHGSSPLLLVCDHASNRVPKKLRGLGLGERELEDHIAWDPGAKLVAQALSEKLDAVLISTGYSRLVIDCNRPLTSSESIAEKSAGIVVPGNLNLSQVDREQRINELFIPYQQTIANMLKREQFNTLLSIHSFTAVIDKEHRPWQVGVACYQNDQFARALFSELEKNRHLTVGFNQPYAIELDYDYTIPVQGEANGYPCAMIEIRQNEINSVDDAERWAETLAVVWRRIASSACP